MKRNEGWEKRLAELVQARMSMPFCWGTFDCVLFAADVVQALTGEDLAAAFRGRYSTELGARRKMLHMFGADVQSVVMRYRFPEILPAAARRGDLGVFDGSGGQTVAVCLGRDWYAPDASGVGLGAHARAEIKRAWRVG